MEAYGDDRMNKMMELDESPYVAEYNDVIAQISKICSVLLHNQKKGKVVNPINEFEVVELCPRIWTLATEYQSLSEDDKKRVFLETLLKGCFSLLAIKSPVVALKVSNSNIHCFF